LPQAKDRKTPDYFNGGIIASDAASLVKIAHVANPIWIRSRDFRVMVAKNRGLELENFQAESAALEWLLQPAKSRPPPTNRHECE